MLLGCSSATSCISSSDCTFGCRGSQKQSATCDQKFLSLLIAFLRCLTRRARLIVAYSPELTTSWAPGIKRMSGIPGLPHSKCIHTQMIVRIPNTGGLTKPMKGDFLWKHFPRPSQEHACFLDSRNIKCQPGKASEPQRKWVGRFRKSAGT